MSLEQNHSQFQENLKMLMVKRFEMICRMFQFRSNGNP